MNRKEMEKMKYSITFPSVHAWGKELVQEWAERADKIIDDWMSNKKWARARRRFNVVQMNRSPSGQAKPLVAALSELYSKIGDEHRQSL